MNYFAHGRNFLDRPYFVAGTAVPDWLNVANRRSKARARNAARWEHDPNPRIADLAQGIIQHHHDDGWFHQTRAFVELSMRFAVSLRELLGNETGFRSGFLGHILVELLLDNSLFEEQPDQLERYYECMQELDVPWLVDILQPMLTKPAPLLEQLIPRFCQERFLFDYQDDDRLLLRLNHVMRRVRLPQLPKQVIDFLPHARAAVQTHRDDLLQAANGSSGPQRDEGQGLS